MKITNEEILEGNRLIAEFMEWEISGPGFASGYANPHNIYCHFEDLKFHSSWDWLIPVVEKIEKLDKIDKVVYFRICGGEIFIAVLKGTQGTDYEFLYHEDGYYENSKINAVYKAVVEFIKWYNGNKNRN